MMREVRCIIAFVTVAFVLAFSCNRAESGAGKTVRVALCQIFALDGDRAGNFVRMENALKEAKERGARLCCFPETALLGWVNPEAHDKAYPIPGRDADRLCDLAKRYGVYICAGLAEKEGEKLYDSAIFVDDQGQILIKHRKINILSELMTPPYTPGQDVVAVETAFGRVGVLICADTFQDEILQRMAMLHPDLLLVPYGWAAPEESWPEHGKELQRVVSEAAQKAGAVVIGTDVVGQITHGPWNGFVYGGQSTAANRDGVILSVASDRDREIMIVEVEIH